MELFHELSALRIHSLTGGVIPPSQSIIHIAAQIDALRMRADFLRAERPDSDFIAGAELIRRRRFGGGPCSERRTAANSGGPQNWFEYHDRISPWGLQESSKPCSKTNTG